MLTQSQSTIQESVQHFSNWIFQFQEQCVFHTSLVKCNPAEQHAAGQPSDVTNRHYAFIVMWLQKYCQCNSLSTITAARQNHQTFSSIGLLNTRQKRRVCSVSNSSGPSLRPWLCKTVTTSIFNNLTYRTYNLWLSADANYQNGAVIMSHSPLPITGANILITHNGDQIHSQLAYLQIEKSFMLY
jgi:hypothetical protein